MYTQVSGRIFFPRIRHGQTSKTTRAKQGLLLQTHTTTQRTAHIRHTTFLNKLNSLKPADDWALELVHSQDQGMAIRNSIIAGTCIAISDGFFKNNRGTSAGIIEDEGVPETRMIILNRVPGIPNDHSPYRAELTGVCGTITMIEQYVEYYKIRSGKAIIGLDGQAVIQRQKTRLYQIHHAQPGPTQVYNQ